MKSKFTFLTSLFWLTAFVVSAQDVEYDDMYFRSKDRVVLIAANSMTLKTTMKQMEVVSAINPTDSYSARNVNPEYLSQSKVNPTSKNQEPVSYFIPDYVPTAVNQNIYNNPQNSGYAGSVWNPYYNYGMGMGMMSSYYPYSPYSSSFGYDPYSPYGYNSMYGGYNNMYRPGWSSGLSFTMGFGSFWGSPWNSFYGMNYGMGYGGGYYGYNSGMYGAPVVIIGGGDANGQGVVYGKRASRSNDLNNYVSNSNRSGAAVVDSQGRTRGSSGRIASAENNAAGSYYQRGWRTNPETNTTRSSWSNSGRTSGTSGNLYNNYTNRSGDSNNGWYNSNSGSRSSGGSGGSNFSGGGGSRSSGGSSGGSSSGGASRSRN